MVDINLGILLLKDQDIKNIYGMLQTFLKRKNYYLSDISHDKLLQSIQNGVNYLLHDRIDQGIARGGWGKSDKRYVLDLFGDNIEKPTIYESISSTVLVIEALYSYAEFLEKIKKESYENIIDTFWSRLQEDLRNYLDTRWDKEKGWGGKLVFNKDGVEEIHPSYKHTSFLLRLWFLFPWYREHIPRTMEYLINYFNKIDWNKELSITAVSVYNSFQLFLQNKKDFSSIRNIDKVEDYAKILEQKIIDKYDSKIMGWSSSKVSNSNIEHGRNTYTLFILSEIANKKYHYPRLEYVLESSLNETIRGKWRGDQNSGLPRILNGPPNLSVSCLGICPLLGKNKLSDEEKKFLLSNMNFIMDTLNDSEIKNQNIHYSWAVGCYVKAVCQYFIKLRT